MTRSALSQPYILLTLILLALLFFSQLVFTDLILARGDTFAYFYPYWHVRDAALADGTLPLWTPELFMGVPLLANTQLGTFYPPNWLTIPLDAPQAIKIQIVIHTVWAGLGMYHLARREARLVPFAALIAAVLFAFSGHIGAHVEQINQLQGLSWMPWLFLFLVLVRSRPALYLPLMGVAWALQLLSGHTQTVFITGVGLGVFALVDAVARHTPIRSRLIALTLIAVAAIFAVILALPQLIPAQELASLSNRGDGLNAQEATAFSWNPALVGRGLLPSYDAQPFAEYIVYFGVIGMGLVLVGAFSAIKRRARLAFVVLVVVGLVFALGRYTPIYLALANYLPGFNLFRVPSRWLVLVALGGAMLAGIGTQALLRRGFRLNRLRLVGIVGVIGGVMLLTLFSDRAQAEVNGAALPSATTWALWLVALAVLVGILFLAEQARSLRFPEIIDGVLSTFGTSQTVFLRGVILAAVVVELWLASANLPYNDPADPAVYDYPRFAASQMQAYNDTAPGRLLSISNLLFDPGDRATLEARWDQLGLSENGAAYSFTATKMQETLAGNLPLIWGIPSIDGFDGGLLPTIHYSAFTSLMLPDGSLRTVDGRLRELLALPVCRGVCLPDDRWLDLTNTRYLLVDKVYDLVYEGIFYDTTLTTSLGDVETVEFDNIQDFEANGVHLLVSGDLCDVVGTCRTPQVAYLRDDGDPVTLTLDPSDDFPQLDGLTLLRYTTDAALNPSAISVTTTDAPLTIHAVSSVDRRTDDFVQLTPPGWSRVYSADIKIYENLDVLPRAFVVRNVLSAPDTWDGTEQALDLMEVQGFNPATTITINGDVPDAEGQSGGTATITADSATQVSIDVDTTQPGYLVLTDAYYPGWLATVNGVETPIERANVMFRAVAIPAGESTVVFEYDPAWLAVATPLWTWGLAVILIGAGWWFSRRYTV